MKKNARLIAAEIIDTVLTKHRSLSDCAPPLLDKLEDPRERAFANELSYGVLRWYFQLNAVLSPLLRKPFKSKDSILKAFLLIGAYQISHMRTPEHAAVSSTVEGAKQTGRPWATALLNGVLRNLLRQHEQLSSTANESLEAEYSHPQWFVGKIKKNWPDDWQEILNQNNQQAGMSLRVNALKENRDDYLATLNELGIECARSEVSTDGIKLLQSINPTTLPGFMEGHVSVQDQAAQQAAGLLDLKPDQNVLDACAAPGGKTAHILEREPNLKALTALDITEKRVALLNDTLSRLGLLSEKVRVIDHDASETEQWWDGKLFDRILLDAPCSATGVIRRHPDIKYHRQPDDIKALVETQRKILTALWPLLASGGRLVYVTCSTLKQENQDQIAWFLSEQKNASESKILAPWGRDLSHGKQILPGNEGMDGFYYACLLKA